MRIIWEKKHNVPFIILKIMCSENAKIDIIGFQN